MAASVLNARLAQADLVTKTNFYAKLSGLNKKITSNKTKHLLVENKLKKLEKLMQPILEVRIILKKMVHKII